MGIDRHGRYGYGTGVLRMSLKVEFVPPEEDQGMFRKNSGVAWFEDVI